MQTFLAQKAAQYLSKELKTEISIKTLTISPFLDVMVEDVSINDQHHRKMFYTKSILLDFGDISFKNHQINIANVIIDHPSIALVKYKNENKVNFQFIADYFASKDTVKTTKKSVWKYGLTGLKLVNAHFIYNLEDKDTIKYGIDFNHIDLSDLNADIRGININGDTVNVDISRLSFNEKSGFKLYLLQSEIAFTPQSLSFKKSTLLTPYSDLKFDLAFAFKNFDNDFADVINKVDIQAIFNKSKLNTNDIAYFVSDLKGMNIQIELLADIKGKIKNFKAKNMIIKTGNHTLFKGNLAMTGLPQIEETFINADIQELYSCKSDIESIILPESSGGKHLVFPKQLTKLGNIRYKGKFTGFYNDFVSYGHIYTDIGIISTDIQLKNNSISKVLSYQGKVGATDFDLGKLLSAENNMGKISLQATVSGSGFDVNTANLTIDGIIKSVNLNQYEYQNIDIKGKYINKSFNGNININDKNIELAFNGIVDLGSGLPQFHITSEIKHANLTELNILKSDSLSEINTSVVMNFRGDNIDNFLGNIEIKNTTFKKNNQKFSIAFLALTNFIDNKGIKVNKIDADFMEGEIKGIKSFDKLQNTFLSFLNVYLPSFKFKTNNYINDTINQNITFAFSFKNSDSILNILVPSLKIADSTKLFGSYSSQNNSLSIKGSSPYIEYQKIRFQNWFINGKSDNLVFLLSTGSKKLILTDTIYVDNFKVSTKTHQDSINYNIEWKNIDTTHNNSADISGLFNLAKYPLFEIMVNESNITIRDTLLTINGGNKITIDSSSIKISNLVIGNNNQQISIDGAVSDLPIDKLNISFKNFNLSNIDAFTVKQEIDLDGTLNGSVMLSDMHYSPNIQADITINNFAFNHEFIDDAVIKSTWDNYQQALLINADIGYAQNSIITKPIEVKGRYYPNSKNNNFDLTIKIDKFKIDPLSKFISSFASQLTGIASGILELKGSNAQPELTGTISFEPAQLKIDFLNTVYHFSQDITFDKNSISFDDVLLYDEKGKTAKLNGKVYHNNFKDWALSLSIRPNDFYCLNTNITQNNLFYGTAFITGQVKIYGTTENINIDVNAKTQKGTQFFIPIPNSSEISDYPFITFVNKDIEKNKKNENVDLSGIKMNFDLEVTPDAEVQLIFDAKIGDILKARGSGNIKLEINTLGDFNMYGDYLIDKGDYLFTFNNVVNKHFEIEKGGTIKWNGDPLDATVNLRTVYPLRASLYDLYNKTNPNIVNPDTSKKRVPVECIIDLSDKLVSPISALNIGFPSLSDFNEQQYKAIVKPEITQQFFTLLVMNRFVLPSQGNTSGSGDNNLLSSSASELLSNQLNNWLSQVSDKFDVGVNYRAGNEINRDELEVALSTQLFNDRLIIDGNVGTGSSQSSSNIVGDVNIEYKWTDDGRFRIKAFNKSNTVDMLNTNPYKQGVGIFYRKEFDSFKDLFKKKNSK